MASGANAFSSRAGFNQSGGAYFICLSGLDSTHTNRIVNAGSNSGGAFVNPTFALDSMANIVGPTGAPNAGQLVGASRLIKDMGKTVVSSGRTFRKFAPVVNNIAGVSTFGVVGSPATATNAGYGSFYLEVAREGLAGNSAPAPIARYF
jgi:hypothetical protein